MKNWKLYLLYSLLAVVAFGCKKQEFTLPPVGEKIPYQPETLPSLRESIAASAATLFYQAWQRSHMDDILKAQTTTTKTYFTLLVPSNAAMESAGYNQQKIQRADPKDLDSLLMFYTLRDRIATEDLTDKADNYNAQTLFVRPDLTVSLGTSAFQYSYRIQLMVKDGKTYANGNVVGAGKYINAKDGYIWLLDQPIPRSPQTITQFLDGDSRFSLLMQLLRYTDSQYNTIQLNGSGYAGTRNSINKYAWSLLNQTTSVRYIYGTTLFLPTNDAFKAAGFNDLNDLLAFNVRKGLPYWGKTSTGSTTMIGNFATDSLLNYSTNWGKLFALEKVTPVGATNVPVFYSNAMSNAVVANYVIVGARDVGNPTKPDGEYYMPLDFSTDAAGNISVKVKGADAAPAKIIQADMPTMMGPVNAIDHLLIPKGYKLN